MEGVVHEQTPKPTSERYLCTFPKGQGREASSPVGQRRPQGRKQVHKEGGLLIAGRIRYIQRVEIPLRYHGAVCDTGFMMEDTDENPLPTPMELRCQRLQRGPALLHNQERK